MLKEQLESARLAIGMVTVTLVVGGTISSASARKFDAPDSRAAQMLDACIKVDAAVERRAGSGRERFALEQQRGSCGCAIECDGEPGSHQRRVHVIDDRRERVDGGDDLGDL